jgi:dynein assembly factor 1
MGLSHLTRLQKLDLSHNALTSMRGLGGLPRLRTLLLNDNCIDRITGIEQLPSLVTLNVSGNKLDSLDGVQCAHKMVDLDVSNNYIGDIYSLEPAVALPFLACLVVKGNPLCLRLRHLRLRIVHRLPGLTSLDGEAVTAEVKVNAANLHGADLVSRRRIFHRVLPDQMFTDPAALIDAAEDAHRSSEAVLDRLSQRLAADAIEAGTREAHTTHTSAMGASVFRTTPSSPATGASRLGPDGAAAL